MARGGRSPLRSLNLKLMPTEELVERIVQTFSEKPRSAPLNGAVRPVKSTEAGHGLAVLFWLVSNGLPFSTVEGEDYHMAHAESAPISVAALERLLPISAAIVRDKIRQIELNFVVYAITTDCWSDANLLPWMAVTYHSSPPRGLCAR